MAVAGALPRLGSMGGVAGPWFGAEGGSERGARATKPVVDTAGPVHVVALIVSAVCTFPTTISQRLGAGGSNE